MHWFWRVSIGLIVACVYGGLSVTVFERHHTWVMEKLGGDVLSLSRPLRTGICVPIAWFAPVTLIAFAVYGLLTWKLGPKRARESERRDCEGLESMEIFGTRSADSVRASGLGLMPLGLTAGQAAVASPEDGGGDGEEHQRNPERDEDGRVDSTYAVEVAESPQNSGLSAKIAVSVKAPLNGGVL